MVTCESLRQMKALVPDPRAMEEAGARWDRIAMPLDGLGLVQEDLIRMAGIRGRADDLLNHPRLLIMCADNGIVEEGVSQTGQETTALVADSIACGESPAAILARGAKCRIRVLDVGMTFDARHPAVVSAKVARGTGNFAGNWTEDPEEDKKGTPWGAMSEEEALAAISIGIKEAKRAGDEGVGILLTGEMGIGNTTTSAACLAALLGLPAEAVTGRGAGLSDAGLAAKRRIIDRALRRLPDRNADAERGRGADAIEILCRLGGLDIAALTGLILGANQERIPVLLDGLITSAAALIADRICPGAGGVCLASHMGREPGMPHALAALGLKPIIQADLALGEGTGALLALELLQAADRVYRSPKTFERLGIESYRRDEG